MRYGVSEVPKRVCRTHQQAHAVDESCPWCVSAPMLVPALSGLPDCTRCSGTGTYKDYTLGHEKVCDCESWAAFP